MSLDVFFVDPEDPEEEIRHAWVGSENTPRDLDVGDRVTLHYLMGSVTQITKTAWPALGLGAGPVPEPHGPRATSPKSRASHQHSPFRLRNENPAERRADERRGGE